MGRVFVCPGPDCGAEYPTEAQRNRCWDAHCTDPASHVQHKLRHAGPQSEDAAE